MSNGKNWKFHIKDPKECKTAIENIIENTISDVIRDICNQCSIDVAIFTSSLRMFYLRSSRCYECEEGLEELRDVLRDKLVSRDASLLNIDTKILTIDGIRSVSFDNDADVCSIGEVLHRFHVFSSFNSFDNNGDYLLLYNLYYVLDNFLNYARAYKALCAILSPLLLLGSPLKGYGLYIDISQYIKEYHERLYKLKE